MTFSWYDTVKDHVIDFLFLIFSFLLWYYNDSVSDMWNLGDILIIYNIKEETYFQINILIKIRISMRPKMSNLWSNRRNELVDDNP